jgi:hypothetical protein
MRLRKRRAEEFRHAVSERLAFGRPIDDLIVHKELPRSVAERIVAEVANVIVDNAEARRAAANLVGDGVGDLDLLPTPDPSKTP